MFRIYGFLPQRPQRFFTEIKEAFLSLCSLWFIVFQTQSAQRILYLCVLCGLFIFNHRGHKGFCISAFSVVYLFSPTKGTKG